MLPVVCPQCGLQIYVPDSVQGNRGVCFACGSPIQVPVKSSGVPQNHLQFKQGTVLSGRYRVLDFLGRGGMGVVYSAQDLLVGEAVALKFMNPRLLQTQAGQRLFIREAQIARRLRHDHIVAVHDVGRLPEGVLYLSMELVKGKSLRSILQECRVKHTLPTVRFAVRIVSQILDALAYAHNRVVHRDMKPENVLILPGEWVKVLDFGLAKAVDSDVKDDGLRADSGRVIGTEAYASPEQKRHQEIDHRSDLYSVGLIFRELLTLRTPREEECVVSSIRSDVSPSLLEVMQRALQEDKNCRWQSASMFRHALLSAFHSSYQTTGPHVSEGRPTTVPSTEGMVYLEGGSFVMGNDAVPEEMPQFEAYVSPFYMDKFPVTVAQYRKFLEATGRQPPKFWNEEHLSNPDQPVVGVSWEDAQAYCVWAGKELPTEIQWEFAARGKENRKYPWGNSEPDPTRANYADHLNMPSIVGMHEEGCTPEGIHDLAGNVFEWTQDWFRPYSITQAERDEPPDPPLRVVRGGSWHSPPDELRTSFRKGVFPETRDTIIGFRCVWTIRKNSDLDV